jgi:hypothetical protein
MRLVLTASLALIIGLASAAQAQEKLEIKDREGTRMARSTWKSHQILSIAGMDVETNVETTTTSSSVTGKADAGGAVRIRETIDALRYDLSLPGNMKVVYDSEKPDAKSDNPDIQSYLDTFRALKGATYTLVVGPDHRVSAVEGTEQILAKAPASTLAELKNRLSEAMLKREANQARAVLPDKPVNKGDRWQRTVVMEIGAGQSLTFDTYYEYAGTAQKDGKTYDKIDSFIGGVTYALDPNSPIPLKLLKSDLKIDSSVGTILFDRETGQVAESSSTTRITGPMTFSVNGQELPGKVDLTLETTSTVR